MAAKSALFAPASVGGHALEHRVVLAPLTRMRGSAYEASNAFMADYYAQRSSKGGLIITEGTFTSPQAGSMNVVPGIWSAPQARYWKAITDAIRAKGAIACCQLWHMGRCAGKREWEYEGRRYSPIGPSAIAENERRPVPREMQLADIEATIAEYANAVKMAIHHAGFHLVEIHNANGYLLDEFLQSKSNTRTDEYGGSIEKRFTMTMRVLQAVTDAVGQQAIGVRFSPYSEFQGMREDQPLKTFVPLVQRVLERFPRLAYIHLVEPRMNGGVDRNNASDSESLDPIREVIAQHNRQTGAGVQLIVAGGLTVESALAHADKHPGDLVAFGRYFISNPGRSCARNTVPCTLLTPASLQTCPSASATGGR